MHVALPDMTAADGAHTTSVRIASNMHAAAVPSLLTGQCCGRCEYAGKQQHSTTVRVNGIYKVCNPPELKTCLGQSVIPLLGIGVALQQPTPEVQIDDCGTIRAQRPQMIC